MRTKLCSAILGLALVAGVHQAAAQLPVITSFSQNGLLVCSNLSPGLPAAVQWASSVAGPWTNWASAAGLDAVIADANGLIQVRVPMFYRVLGVPHPTNALTSDGMALIPAGTFTMGDITDTNLYGDAAPTNIYVSAFYMDTNLVSWSQWQGVYSYATNHGYQFFTNTSYGVYQAGGKAANHPVQRVDWWDCVKWSNARSVQAGLVPVYYTDAGFTQVYTNGEPATVYQDLAHNGYRLPTEAEWEKAARGGLSGQRFPLGNTISWGQANYYGYPASAGGYGYDLATSQNFDPTFATNGFPYTSPVGYFPANGYGLHDMAGNVLEWCWDWYATAYGQPSNTNPTGPVGPVSVRVLRGGVWNAYASFARCAFRNYDNPADAYSDFGFRCVRGL